MTDLMRFMDTFEISLSDEFLSVDRPSVIGGFDNASIVEKIGPAISLRPLDELVQEIMEAFERYDTGMDSAMAEKLHRVLPLSRRQAVDRKMWSWLGVARYPDFVAWRWKEKSGDGRRSAERFMGDRVRQTFSRLWWAAELTRAGSDYSLTNRMYSLPGFQDIYEAVFGRAFCNYRPALVAFVQVVEGKNEKFIRKFAKELGYVFSTTLLESMDENELTDLMKDIAGQVRV